MSVSKRKQTGTSYPWSQRKISISNPFPRYGHSASQNTTTTNEFFLFGGVSRGKPRNEAFAVEVSTLNVLAFVTSGDIPSSRSGHTHVNIGKNIIVFGGLIDESTNNADENLYILDTVSKVWSKLSVQGTLPLARHGHSVTVIGTKMYVFGGQHVGRHLNDLISFDVKTRTSWEFITPNGQLPPCRSGHVSFAYKDKIYIFGGIDENKCYNDVWCYDIRANTWSELQCTGFIPIARYNHGSSIVDDVIYVFGGRTFDEQELGDLTAFRITNQRWYMFQKMGPAPSPRFRHTMTAAQNKIFVFGGESANSPKPDEEGIIHILDTSKIKYPPLNAPPANPQQIQQGSPKGSLNNKTSQSSIDSDGIQRPPTRQSSMPREEEPIVDETPFDIQQLPRSIPENMEGGVYPSVQQLQQQIPARSSPQLYNQPNQQGFPRGPGYSPYVTGSPPPRGFSPYDIIMSNSKGNPPEQITYIERSVSPQQQRSIQQQQYSNSIDKLRMKTPSPFGGVARPLIQSQRSNEGFRENNSQQSRSVKKQSIFENPRQAPRPPNSYNYNNMASMSPTSPTNTMPPSPMPYEDGGSTVVNSPRTPVSDNVDHSLLRDERDQIIAAYKKRELWFRTELSLARKSGYIPDTDFDNPPPDGIDIENLLDIGDPNSEKYKVMEVVIRLKQEILRSKASIANQAQIASQKILDSERARTVALQEAVYLKAKLVAITNASESELASIEMERAEDLEKRLIQALTEKEDAQGKFIQCQQNLDYEKTSRESAEERAKNSTVRAEEAEEAHARVLAELATLHSRATSAESSLREIKTKLAETTAELTQCRSENDNAQLQLGQLQLSIDQHKRALEKANNALTAANERTNEFESLWKQARQDIINLEKESAGLRAELDVKMRDLDRSKARTSDMERLLDKAQKESEAMRSMMQEGMTKLLNNSSNLNSPNSDTNDTLDANDKLKLVEQELSELKLINNEAQKIANEASTNLSETMVKMLQLESSVMKARSESSSLQRRLAESNDEIIRTKGRLREKERILEEKSRALEDAEVKIGMMRDVMTERGILEEGSGNFTGVSLSSRFREMEARCEELESMHAKTQAELKSSIKKYKDALQDAESKSKVLEEELERASSKSLTPDISSSQALEDELKISETKLNETQRRLDDTKQKLNKMETDYKTATTYVKNTEKMLRRVKDELTKSNSENLKYKQQLSAIQKQNGNLEDKVVELENQVSLQKGFRASRQDFANVKQLVAQREEFLKEKDEMKKLIESAREEQLMSNQSYEALRREYDYIRKEYNLLRKNVDSIQKQLAKSEKEVKDLQGELEETLSLNEVLNQQLDEALKNNGNVREINERRISSINREQRWKDQKDSLERQNKQLREENTELDNKLRESENKISLLLDQMETTVEVRETTPRNSRISSLVNDPTRASSRLEEYDEIMATLDAVEKAAAERSRTNINAI